MILVVSVLANVWSGYRIAKFYSFEMVSIISCEKKETLWSIREIENAHPFTFHDPVM
jgi:hypothetical protein